MPVSVLPALGRGTEGQVGVRLQISEVLRRSGAFFRV